ncbi:MAG: ornithine cyclodeaminase family protein, partial [Acetobacteraceae bacterium]|nr:ornithine cyclodeaminase family protein [Acetobacteraceae bacterium]
MRVLSGADIAGLVDAAALMPVLARAMRGVSAGQMEYPPRGMMPLGEGNHLGVMQGALVDPPSYGAKLLSLFPGNPEHGRSSHAGLMVLFDRETGLPRAVLDASVLTALRTAAASALATDVLARPDAAHLAIIGTGEEAAHHVHALRRVRHFSQIVVWGRHADRAARFAAEHGTAVAPSLPAALDGADVVCTCTAATAAFLAAAMLPPGSHLNAVGGSVPAQRELHPDCIAALRVVTDYRPAMEAGAGEVQEARRLGLIAPDHPIAEIGEVLAGQVPGRSAPEERTLYRSLGVVAQDLAAAVHIVALAAARGVGTEAQL